MSTRLPELIDKYSSLVLAMAEDEHEDPLFERFYQIQMAFYILSRLDHDFSLKYALEAYQLISDEWDLLKEEFESTPFNICNYDNIFKSVHIDFPTDFRQIVLYNPMTPVLYVSN